MTDGTNSTGRRPGHVPEPDGLAPGDDVVRIPLSSLVPGPSARLNGQSAEHIQMLAESTADLPPIVVQRSTLRVIDGIHRLKAIELRGQSMIDVRFFDGTDSDAFVLSVQANISHGLPLSPADRTAAATTILESHPEWSDRRIAAATGMAPRTIGGIRVKTTGAASASDRRVGRDGRARPLNSEAKRRRAEALIAERPSASLREIARAVGMAPSTVRSVRERVNAGLAAASVPRRVAQLGSEPAGGSRSIKVASSPPRARRAAAVERPVALQSLRKDPSLRFNEVGRILLQWLDSAPADPERQQRVLDAVPAHCLDAVISLARDNCRAWEEFAQQLEHLSTPAVSQKRNERSIRIGASSGR